MNSSVVPAGRSSTSSLRSSLYDTVYRSSPMLLPRSSLSPAGAGACFSFLAPNSCARSARPALAPLFDTRIHRGVRVPPGRMHGAQTHAGSKGARGQEGERGGGNERASEQRTALQHAEQDTRAGTGPPHAATAGTHTRGNVLVGRCRARSDCRAGSPAHSDDSDGAKASLPEAAQTAKRTTGRRQRVSPPAADGSRAHGCCSSATRGVRAPAAPADSPATGLTIPRAGRP